MGYEGWLSVAGTEVINNDRVRAYASALVPGLQMGVGVEESGETLRRLLDDQPYTTPMLDDAPWVDPDDPDTYGFCGVLGLSAVGLSDSTRTGSIVEYTGDGGGVNGLRKGSRSVRYSALLVGASQAAVEAGHAWLSAALAGDCDADCNGSDLCYLQALTDPQDWGDRVTTGVSVKSLTASSPPGTYTAGTGYWNPSTATQELRTASFPKPLPCDEIIWTWTFSGGSGTKVALRSYSETGKVFEDWVTIDSDGQATKSISDMNNGKTTAYSAIRLPGAGDVTVQKVTVEYRDESKDSGCFDHYQRQLFETRPLEGPTTVQEYESNCGAMRKVEFTISTGLPWTFGKYNLLLSSSLSKVGADQETALFKLSKTIPLPDPAKNPKAATWIADPACPKVPAPPRPTATFTDCKPSTTFYASYGLSITGSAIPLWHDAVPRLLLTVGGKEARGVRVRFFPRPLGTFQDASDLDPATVCGEFVIDYIPPSSTFILDGITRHAEIKRPGYANSPGDHLLSGLTAEALFQWPVLTCGMDYMCVIDVDGEAESVTNVGLYLVTRWG